MTNKVTKFVDADRKLLIQEIEHTQKIKLESIKPSRKLFKSSNGLIFLIFGGTEDWHGISENIIQQLYNLEANNW